MKQLIKKIPVLRSIARALYRRWAKPPQPFAGSQDYWISRYDAGGNSGDGSYRKLAEFKADILNGLVAQHGIRSVIEYGCGDGNQLRLASYPAYLGFDISPRAVALCRQTFAGDASKSFQLMDAYAGETAELTLSLDVVYHLVEDAVFAAYMHRLFDSATRLVVVYSSDTDANPAGQAAHVRHRHFSRWVATTKPDWRLARTIPNRYPFNGATKTGSFADFFVFERIAQVGR